MQKIDVYHHEQRYLNWKNEVVDSKGNVNKRYIDTGLTRENSDILIQFIFDMERGENTSKKVKRGGRSYGRLNNLRQKLNQTFRWLQERGVNDVTQVTEKQLSQVFSDMQRGNIKTAKGEIYKAVSDYSKIFKSFWHWWMKVNRKQGINLIDICEDIDSREPERPFVMITKAELDKMLPYFDLNEQTILLFMFDSLIRSPTELMSLKVENIIE